MIKSIFQKRWAYLKRTAVLGCWVLFFCLLRLSSLYASEIPGNLNISFEFQEYQNINPYCSSNYFYELDLHWTVPPQATHICYYQIYQNGVSIGTSGTTLYRIQSLSGCFGGGYSDFLSQVNSRVLEPYYYNSTYTVVAVQNCAGLPDIVDQITVGDETSINNASNPPLPIQAPLKATTVVAEPINVATGNMSTSQTDILIPAKEIPLQLSRTYNSQDNFNGQFGYGWRSNFDTTLTQCPVNSSVVEADEQDVYTIYTKNMADGSYTPSAGKYSVLTKNPDLTYTIVRKHGRMLTFDTQGRLVKIQERNGNINEPDILTGGTATANDSTYGAASNTVDNNTGTYWAPNTAPPSEAWWKYDLGVGVTKTVGKLRIYPLNASGLRVKDFILEGSNNDSAYYHIYTGQNPNSAGWSDFTFPNFTAYRYYKLTFSTTWSGTGYAVEELEMMETPVVTAIPSSLSILRDYNGKITEVDDAFGRKLLFTNDASGRVTQIKDPANRIWTYAYDANGNLSQVTDPLNNVTAYQYDTNHKLVQKTDANGHVLYFQYDSSGRAYHSWQDGNVNEVTLAFDPVNSATTVTDSRNNATKYEYNTYGLVTKITDVQNNIQTAAWDTSFNKTSSTDQNSHTTNYTYDGRGNLLTQTDPLNNTKTFTYESIFDFIKTVTDAQNNVTTYDYDAKGNVIKVTDALGNFTTNVYDTSGQITSSTNPKNYTTNFTYDTYGNVTTTTDALNNTTTFSYDILGNRTQIQDAQNNIAQFTYDNLNQLTQVTYPDNSKVSYTYDALGNKTSSTDNASNTFSYTYDLNNHVTSMTNPLGKTIAFGYDTEGNRTTVTDQNLNQTSYQYDSLNRLILETNPLSLNKSYAYDPVGNRTSVTDAKGNIITYEYDSLDHLTKINYPGGSAVSFTYDSLGRRITMTDSQGTTAYIYDKLGRLTQIDGPGQNDTFQYTYDQSGNRTSLISPDNKTTTYSYDALNRIASIVDPNNKTTTHTYDTVGNPATIIYPNGIQATYAFDALHRLTHLINQQQGGGQTKLSEFSYTYDQAGRKSSVTLLDGIINYQYDALGELISENKSSGSNQYQISYEYDSAGNRTRMVKDGKEHLYTYNSANQLTQETINGPATVPVTVTGTVSDANGIQAVSVNGVNATLNGNDFTCQLNLSPGANTLTVSATDVAGNTATKSVNVTYNQAKQTSYLYDNNGNLITKQSVDQTLNLSYDYENRLNSVVSGAMNIAYSYDGEGKRISTTNGFVVTNYLYDGKDAALERNNAGVTTTSYLRVPNTAGGIGGIINAQQGTNPENYYSYDGLGSVANLSDVTGTNLQSYSYDAFGNQLNQSTVQNTHQFLTKEIDPSGFIYFGARFYDPSIGRFITQDPLGMVDGVNLYLYCHNNATNLVDTNGDLAIGAIVGGFFGGVSGAWGAHIQGGSVRDMIVGGIIGGVFGAAIGSLDLSEGVATVAWISATSGAAGDIFGQLVATNFDLSRFNASETYGAAIGSAIGGIWGAESTLAYEELGYGEWAANIRGGLAGLLPSTYGGYYGGLLNGQQSNNNNGGKTCGKS